MEGGAKAATAVMPATRRWFQVSTTGARGTCGKHLRAAGPWVPLGAGHGVWTPCFCPALSDSWVQTHILHPWREGL